MHAATTAVKTRSAAPPRASVEAVLRFAWSTGVFTSSDVLPETGLTRSTAIDAIEVLIEAGLLIERPNARAVGEYRKGRPSRRFELDADAGVVAGMDAGRGHLTTTIADLRGEVLAQRSIDVDAEDDSADTRRSAVVAELDHALEDARRAPGELVSVCVGVPAPVDASGRSPRPAVNDFWYRMNPGLVDLLADRAPVVRVENDASLAAIAEGAHGGAQGCRDYLMLLAGERLGAGVVLDGRLLHGTHGGVGEAVAFDHVAAVGSSDGLDHRLLEWAGDAATDARTVALAAAAGEPWARELVERLVPVLARVVSVFTSFFDPAVVVVSSAVTALVPGFVDEVSTAVAAAIDLPAPRVMASALGPQVVSTGAVAAALEVARHEILRLRS